MDLSKSIDFLLDKAGDVIQYRLHKEILQDLSRTEEENLLEKVMLTLHYQLLKSYQKSNGYIGIGMHSWDKFKETPLQDGEAAARLISNYAIPKDTPLVSDFAKALQDDNILEEEFSYYAPEKNRFQSRFVGTESGTSLKLLIDTCLALMGYGDDGIIEDTKVKSYRAFISLLKADSFNGITQYNPNSKKKYNYRYIEAGTYFPCLYHLQVLSHTDSWKNDDSQTELARAMNHINEIFHEDNNLHVKHGNTYYVPLWAMLHPIYTYEPHRKNTCYRRTLTDIAKMGIGSRIKAVNTSAVSLLYDLEKDGILRMSFKSSYEKRAYKTGQQYPTPYSEVSLEVDYKDDIRLWCDLTFWAVQFLSLYRGNSYREENGWKTQDSLC